MHLTSNKLISNLFLGLVEKLDQATATARIKFMERNRQKFIWHAKPYVDNVEITSILCAIGEAPSPVSQTGRLWDFTPKTLDTVNKVFTSVLEK